MLKVGSSLGRAAATVPALPDPSGRTHLSRVRVPEARPRLRPARLGPKPAGGREGLPRGGSGGGGTRVRRGRGANSPALRLPLARAPRRHLEAEERAEARGGRGGQGRVRLPGGLLRAIALPWGTRRGPEASPPPAYLGSLAGRGSGDQVARLLLPELRLRVSCDLVNLTSVGWAPKSELGKGRAFLSPAPTPTSSQVPPRPARTLPSPHSPPAGSCPTSCCPLCPPFTDGEVPHAVSLPRPTPPALAPWRRARRENGRNEKPAAASSLDPSGLCVPLCGGTLRTPASAGTVRSAHQLLFSLMFLLLGPFSVVLSHPFFSPSLKGGAPSGALQPACTSL